MFEGLLDEFEVTHKQFNYINIDIAKLYLSLSLLKPSPY